MTEDGRNPAWDSLDAGRRADLARRMAVYAAMVGNMDANIGRLVESLRAHDELENTLILFLSDNGACAEWEPFGFDLDAADYRNNRPGHGVDGATPQKPNVLHTGEALEAMGAPGSLFSYGCAWANLSNTPLSFYKHYAHEGGIRTPMIAHWPARIADKGALRSQVAHVMDLMATFLDVAYTEYPVTYNGRELLPMEGRSLLPAFANQEWSEPRALVFEHERNVAVREGDWKLVAHDVIRRDGLRPDPVWELYDVAADPVEQRNLASEHPERVERLSRMFLEEARRTLVLPAP